VEACILRPGKIEITGHNESISSEHEADVGAVGRIPLGADSEPEPDLAVVPGSPGVSGDAQPSHAVLVVEFADARVRLGWTGG
jgi:hypothetical protein